MHAPLNPSRVVYFFVYLGALVEALTGAGAGRMAASTPGTDRYVSGGTLIAVAVVLQGGVEIVFVAMVVLMHQWCVKSGMLAWNVKVVCVTLYGCSMLVLVRCVFRAVEAFTMYTRDCGGVYCGSLARHEWYLYVFEATPMVLYTYWLNLVHPGSFLPRERKRYLDLDGRTERMGPGWVDGRPVWKTFVDPFNTLDDDRAGGQHTKFWLEPRKWAVCEDGRFPSWIRI